MMQLKNVKDSSENGKNKIIYTDGGCYNNGDRKGTGSFAFLEPADLSKEYVDVYGGYRCDATNNRTEMLAVLYGLSINKNPDGIINIISDSGYVVKGYTDPSYLDRWVANGWRTSTKTPVLNKDLWLELIKISWHTSFIMSLIKGHMKDSNGYHAFWNDICDKCCTFIMNDISDVNTNTIYHMRYSFKAKKVELIDSISDYVMIGGIINE